MFSQNAINWITWIGFIITVLGFIASGYGIYVSNRQALQAKKVANLASERSEEALRMVRSRTRLSALSSAVSQTGTVISIMDSGHTQATRAYFTSFRREVQEAIAMSPDYEDIARQAKIVLVYKKLDSIASLIDSKKDNPDVIRSGIINHIGFITSFLVQEESTAKSEMK